MKKFLIVSANFIIIFAIIFFVIRYADDKRNESSREQTEYFLESTVAMERVTANYLEGEQHICDTWANTINAYGMTVDEAMTFLTSALTVQGASAQIIFDDDGIYSGFSTETHKTDPQRPHGLVQGDKYIHRCFFRRNGKHICAGHKNIYQSR